jgi:hypothetical protein
MSFNLDEDPTVPPPGRRAGVGLWSIVPYLQRTLEAKPKASAPSQDTGPQLDRPSTAPAPDDKSRS